MYECTFLVNTRGALHERKYAKNEISEWLTTVIKWANDGAGSKGGNEILKGWN